MTLEEFAQAMNALVAEGYGKATVVLTMEDHTGDDEVIALDQHLS